MTTGQNKTHGVLTTGEILSLDIRANITNDEAIRFARAVETAVLTKAAPQSPVTPASVEMALDALRAEQAAAVMPLIGPLLDAWENVLNDEKGHLRKIGIGKHLDSINRAMVGNAPVASADDDLLEVARATGLRQHMHGVNATDARLILQRFVGALGFLGPVVNAVAPAVCQTCGGSRIDPGGLPICRDCKPFAPADERALQAAAKAVENSADVWEGFSMQDAKTCVQAYCAALPCELIEGISPTVSSTDIYNYKSMFENAVRALASIDRLLGVPEDGCNDPQMTVSALADFMAGHRDMQKSRNDLLDDNYSLTAAPTPPTSAADAVAAEYNEWIRYHAAGTGDFDDFLQMVNERAAIAASKETT